MNGQLSLPFCSNIDNASQWKIAVCMFVKQRMLSVRKALGASVASAPRQFWYYIYQAITPIRTGLVDFEDKKVPAPC